MNHPNTTGRSRSYATDTAHHQQNILPCLRALATPLLVLTMAGSAWAAGGGVSGRVLNANTGKYLEGADITVNGTELHTTSEREGYFTLNEIPAGNQQVVINYPGLDPQVVTVTIVNDKTTDLQVQFKDETIILEALQVSSAKEGMAAATAVQKASPNFKIVASGDQYGDIAEGNAAEYLKYLPGIGIDYNANDARAVTLRGMSTAFTNVTMNGTAIASATSGNLNRRFEFEQLSINNIERIEVVKTLTPDLPATSTGGTINLVSKSAFDRKGDLFTYRVYMQGINSDLSLDKSPGYGESNRYKVSPGIDVNYAKHLTKDLGLNISYKESQLINDYPRSSYSWDYNPADGGTPAHPVLTSWNLQNEQKITKRQGASIQLDYNLGDSTRISLMGAWTFYNLFFTDRTLTVNTGTVTALSTSSSPWTGTAFNGLSGKGSVTLQEIYRNKSGVTYDIPLNITHTFGDGSKLEGSAYWSQAYSHYRDTNGGYYSDVTITRGGTNPKTNTVTDPLTVSFYNIGGIVPNYNILDSAGSQVDFTDPTKFTVTQIRSRPQTGVDTKDGVGLSYKKDFRYIIPFTVKVGGQVDYTTRNIVNPIFNRTGTSATTGFGGASAITGTAMSSLMDTNFSTTSIGYGLPAYSFPDVYKFYAAYGGLGYLPYTPASDIRARFEDTTKSGYVRLDLNPRSDLLVVGGVRYENRETDGSNNLLTLGQPAKGTFKDSSWFPSVNVKYTPFKKFALRLGYSKSIGLPDYSDLLPGPATITDPVGTTRGKISVYNGNIKAYQIDNFDAGVEYYFTQSSFVSLSVFRKKMTNYIITATQQLNATNAAALGVSTNSLGYSMDQYDVTTKFNVPDAGYYNGIEAVYAQNLKFLPHPFNTMGIQVNGTMLSIDPIKTNMVFSSTDANLNNAVLQQVNKNLTLAAVKQSYNVSLNWALGKFGFTLEDNYTGRVLKAISQKTVKYSDLSANQYFNEMQYQAPRNTVDIRMDYKWSDRLTPYFQVRNVLGRPIVFSTDNLPFNHSEYGDPIYEIGIRGTW